MVIVYGLALSTHIGLQGDYSSLHPYIKAENNDYIAGMYYNSEDRVSLFAGKQFVFDDKTSVELGLVSGYTSKDVLPMLKLNYDKFFVAPAYEEHNGKRYGTTVGVQFDF